MAKFGNVNLIEHPLIRHYLGILRNKDTECAEFRRMIGEISRLLAYEATSDLKMQEKKIETPLAKSTVEFASESPVIVSIMRAGNGMLEGLLSMIPFASAGHIGIYRDKFIENTVEYYFRLPENVEGRSVYLADPMVATGDTVIASLDRLKQYNVGKIKILTIIISHQAVERLAQMHPDVEIVSAAVEKELDAKGYLIPGIGDVGNRLYASG